MTPASNRGLSWNLYALENIPLIEFNPYAAPTTQVDLTCDVVEKAKPRLARPATALITMASTHSVFAAIFLVCGTIDFLAGRMSATESLPLFVVFAQFTSLVVIAIGAAKMGFLESYTMARTAAILACIPFVTPFMIIGIPFGIWSLRLLAEPEIVQAFQTAAERRNKSDNAHSW